MKEKGVFKNINGALVPQDARAKKIITALPEGTKTLAWIHTARYVEHHRFAFAVLQKIANAIGQSVEVVLLYIKYETGRFDWLKMPDGRTVENPHSIAFESMDQKEFQSFWQDAMLVVTEKLLPKMEQSDYLEIRDMLAGKVD